MKKFIRSIFRHFKYDIIRFNPEYDSLGDFTDEEKAIINSVRPFTMTSVERIASLVATVGYLSRNKIPGDIVECGVWRGGSMMAIASTLIANKDTTRSLYLYDTYEGMSAPSEHDKTSSTGEDAAKLLSRESKPDTGNWAAGVLCYASLEDVRHNVLSTGYPPEKIHFVKGKVEDSIPNTAPKSISLLRLDTDWYESTRHELKHLYPLLDRDGILIIDDYGDWQGARKAVDEYFQGGEPPTFFHRIDHTGRLILKRHAL